MSDLTTTLTPDDFGPERHGVNIYNAEDGSYLAYGHHEPRRIAAAISHEAREYDYDAPELADILGEIDERWMNRITRHPDGEWEGEWCRSDDPGAVPVTTVFRPVLAVSTDA